MPDSKPWPGISIWYTNDGDLGKWIWLPNGWRIYVHSSTPDDYFTKDLDARSC